MSENVFVLVIAEADFPEDGKYTATVNGWNILIARADGAYHAFNDRCPHAASLLSPGRVRRGHILCPLHGAMFNLATGANVGGTYDALRTFPLKLEDGQIAVAVPTENPGMADLAIKIL